MGKTVVNVSHVTKIFNIYRRDIQKIKCVLFGKEPSEVLVALKDVSLRLEEGECIGIAGLVGSGRSTLINLISGVTFPSKGKVEAPKSINPMLNQRAGLEPEFSCVENIYLKANIVGIPKAVVEKHVDEILEFAEAKDYADLPMKRAPKGVPAYISLAVHLLKDADLLIADEVFGGGGNNSRIKCEKYFKEYLLNHEKVSAIVVSNNMGFLKGMCNRVFVLNEGEIIFEGPADEAGAKLRSLYSQ